MGYGLMILIPAAAVVFLLVKGFLEGKRQQSERKEQICAAWGRPPENDYDKKLPDRLRRYDKAWGHTFSVDDITWNDLDMDRLFGRMNYTFSLSGEEFLYRMLRTPDLMKEEWAGMEETLKYFAENKREREELCLLLAGDGKSARHSIYDYLGYLEKEEGRGNGRQYLADLCYAAAFFLMMYSAPAGLAALTGVICFQVVTYFPGKQKISSYSASLRSILSLLERGRLFARLPGDGMSKEKEAVQKIRGKLGRLGKNGRRIIVGEKADGSPAQIVGAYMRMLFHTDLIRFNRLKKETALHEKEIRRLAAVMGWVEAAVSILLFRSSLESWCIPREGAGLILADAWHPLVEEPVKNSIRASQGVLLTGSNASGKSTFLRTAAVNVLLAQGIHTACAKRYEAPFLRLYTSIEIRDSLLRKESCYVAEIRSLKRILDAWQKEPEQPSICFIDEILRGTNTVERIAASTSILQKLAGGNGICFAATHDMELTELLEGRYDNYHFEEDIRDGDVSFSYRLMRGRAGTRNALRLLQVMGYEKELVCLAKELSEHFEKEGTWK